MTDHRKATDNVVVKKDATDASTKLSTEANDKPVVKKPADVVTDKAKEAIEAKAKEVNGHYNNAAAAYAEMDGYLSGKKPLTDKVTVPGADGKPHEVTVADRMKELKHTINAEANGAVYEAGKVDQKAVSALLDNAITDRATKAKDLDLNVNKLTEKSIKEAITQTSDAGRLGKLNELLQSQENFDHLKRISNMPAYTKLVYAQYKGGGYTNENTPVERDEKGSLKVDQRDILDAMSLLHEAGGNNADLRNNDLYLQTVNKIFPKLENGSAKIQTITSELEDGIKFGKEGNKAEQEKALKLAVAQADSVNVPLLSQLVKDPNFSGRQSEAVLTEMASTVVLASTARLQYAQFLAEQGRFGEAQVQTTRVKSECPDVMYNLTEKGELQLGPDGKPLYNNSRYVDLAKLDQQVTQSSTFNPNKLNADIQSFTSQFAKLQGGATDGSKETDSSRGAKGQNNAAVQADLNALSASMNGQLATERQQLTAGKAALDAEKARLTEEQKVLATKPVLTEDARKIENARIERELGMLTLQQTQLDAQIKANNHNTSLVKYLEVNNDIAHEDRSAANAKLEQIAKGDPDFVREHQKELDQLKEAAKEPGWWDSWGKKAFVIGAVVVGVAAGIWLGPGCLASGAALGTAAAAAVGVTSATGLMVAGTVGAVGGLTVLSAGVGATTAGLTYAGRSLADATHGTDGHTTKGQDVSQAFWAGGTSCFTTGLGGIGGAVKAAPLVQAARLSKAITAAETATRAATIAETGLTVEAAKGLQLTASQLQTANATARASLEVAKSTGKINGVLSGVFGEARVPIVSSALGWQAIGQASETYNGLKEIREKGSDFKSSDSGSFFLWGQQRDNEANSLSQASRIRSNFANNFDGLSFYTKEVKSTYQPKTVVGNRSVFDDALQIAVDREQDK